MYLRVKFQVSSIILTSFRRIILPPPQNEPLESPPRLGLRYIREAKRSSKVRWKELKNSAGKSVPAKLDLIWWCYMSFFQSISISISQLGLGVFKILSFIEKNNGLFYSYLRKFFFFKKMLFIFYCACMWYLINFSILSRSVPISMFLYLSFIYYLNIWKNLLFFLIQQKVG